jgi:hypothetical protein
MFKLFLLLISLAIFACNSKSGTDYKNLVIVYAELRIAEQEYHETEDGKAIRFQILQRHELSADAFEEKMEEIKKEPKKWAEFQKMLMTVLDSITNSNKPEEEI